jgi:Bacterial Ig-like domain (group 3)
MHAGYCIRSDSYLQGLGNGMSKILRFGLGWLAVCLAAWCYGGTLTLKSPLEGNYLGLSNTIKFLVTGATVDVDVKATVTGPAGVVTVDKSFTPNSDGKVDDTLTLNFNNTTPEGSYKIVLTATEPGNTYAPQTVNVRVDVVAPKFLEISPNDGAFVKGVVRIRATLKETNIKSWEVQVNNQTIPNNNGTTNSVAVDWNTTSIPNDGSNSITVTAKDQAGNQATKTISVTLDRVKPIITIAYPRSDSNILRGATIPVLVDFVDASSSSIDVTGMDVLVQKLDGTYITRVARISVSASAANAQRYTGRILWKAGLLPSKFKIVASGVDRAGNVAVPQEVVVQLK